ncbi:MAG: MerR family transcriptional regulator [Anaerolineae bacterium]|nr:MerR family transcriptional regulator [Anaerolineae bacterium]
MQIWQIGDIVKKSGVPASTIRYYEEIELLPPAERVNGRRRYSDTILQKLNIIRLAQQAGFTIVEIQTLLHNLPADAPPSARWQVMAEQKLTELDERMQTMQAMKALLEQTLNCECETLEACGSGIENGATSGVTLNC